MKIQLPGAGLFRDVSIPIAMSCGKWILISSVSKPETKKMFVAISKSNSNNELISSVKSVKGTVIKTVKMFVKMNVDISTAVVTNWSIYHKLSEKFKKKHEVIVYSPKMDWCEDVWQSTSAKDFVDWHMDNYDRILVLGGANFIKKFTTEVGEMVGETPIKFNHVITVTGVNKVKDRKGWPILKTAEYNKAPGFFGPTNDHQNVNVYNLISI